MWEIVGVGKWACWETVMRIAARRAKLNPEEPPLVRYLGTLPPWPNADPQRSVFYVWANGKRDHAPDPNWHTKPRP